MASQSNKSSVMKSKSSSGYQDGPSSSSKPRADLSLNKKKVVESSTKQFADAKQKSFTKTEVKGKTVLASSSKTVTKTVTTTVTITKGKKEKKVYSLAGQKFDPPEEREPLRIFYESLSKQIPSSEMAEFWMMEHGLLSPERAKRAFDKKQRKQKQLRSGIPIKSPPPYVPSKPESSRRQQQQVPKNGEVKAKKRVVNDSDDDDDFVLSHKRRKG